MCADSVRLTSFSCFSMAGINRAASNATAATQIPPSKPATAALYLDETLRDSTLAARIANGDLDRPTRNERYKKDDRYYGTYMMQQRADTAPW